MATTQVNTKLDFGGGRRATNLAPAQANGEAVTYEQLNSAVEAISWKESARAASTVNLNLSAPGAAIDGITLASGDRVLVKDQTDSTENGIYIFNGSASTMTRAADASDFDELEAAVILVEEGTSNGATTYRQTEVNGTIDSSDVIWTTFGATVPDASTTVKGKIEIATQAEADAGTDAVRAITPATLSNYSGMLQKATANFGDGVATSYTITHNFGHKDVVVFIRESSGDRRQVLTEVRVNNDNSVDILTETAPASNALKAIIIG